MSQTVRTSAGSCMKCPACGQLGASPNVAAARPPANSGDGNDASSQAGRKAAFAAAPCTHEIWEMDTAIADGLCPLCLHLRLRAAESRLAKDAQRKRDECTRTEQWYDNHDPYDLSKTKS